MSVRRINEPLTAKSALITLGILCCGIGLLFGGKQLWQWLGGDSNSPAHARREVWSYLKKQARPKDFHKSSYDFNLKESVALLQTNLIVLRLETASLQTNLAVANVDLRKLRTEGEKLQDQERSLRREVRGVEGVVEEKKQRLTNRLAELSLTRSNLLRATTNSIVANTDREGLQARTVQLTNAVSLVLSNIAGASTRLADLKSNTTALQSQSKALSKQLASRQQELKTLRGSPAKNGVRKQSTKPEPAAAGTPVQAPDQQIEGEITLPQTTLANLPVEISNRLARADVVHHELTDLQGVLAVRQQELSTARRQLTDKRQEAAERERALGTVGARLTLFQSNATVLVTNVTLAEGQLSDKRGTLLAKQKEFEAKTASLATRQKEAAALQEQLQARQKEASEHRRTLEAKEQELRRQVSSFQTDIQKKVTQASSYEGIYYSIGQQLHVAEKLLASKATLDQQQGLRLAAEAAQHAFQDAEQSSLAARICEGYLLPNLNLADDKGRIGYSADWLISHCNSIFERAEELPLVVKTLRISLSRSLTNAPAKADNARFYLGNALERNGQYDEALALYRQIQDTNQTRRVEQRIAATQALKEQRAAAR